jgi:hypothetical protein
MARGLETADGLRSSLTLVLYLERAGAPMLRNGGNVDCRVASDRDV